MNRRRNMKTRIKRALVFGAVFFALGGVVSAGTINLDVSVSNPYLLAGRTQSVYLKIGVSGGVTFSRSERPAANVAIVLDRSGSMSGEKLRRAKEAAMMAVDLLDERDTLSVVAYSDTVSVLVPAARVTNRAAIRRRIEALHASGSTALFAGVSKGAEEVNKFLEKNKVNRVILLSDGIANVGPDSPMALGNLGAALKQSGVSVSTIGLGLDYNEDLMVRLARQSEGNHAFVENYADLERIFRYEFNDIMSVVARDVEIEITCTEGVRPVRILGRGGDIIGGRIYSSIGQLYGSQEKYILVELDVPPREEGRNLNLAKVNVTYNTMDTGRAEVLQGGAGVTFTRSERKVEESQDTKTMVEAARQITADVKEQAVQLRDEGRVDDAKGLLRSNSLFLQEEASKLSAPELQALGQASGAAADAIEDESNWNANRKRMKAETYEAQTQQSY
jgi:Ca-activated chloride channel family protein